MAAPRHWPRPDVGDLLCYLRAYYRRVAVEDLAAASRLAAAAAASRPGSPRTGRRAGPSSRSGARRRAPDAFDPSGLVIDIVTDDMPYLVDSVTMELDRHGRDQSIVHPLLRVRRDVAGTLHEVRGDLGPGRRRRETPNPGPQTRRTGPGRHVATGPAPRQAPGEAEQLAAELGRTAPCWTTCGWPSRTSRGWARWPAGWPTGWPRKAPGPRAETGRLLRWLADSHFTVPRLPRVRPGGPIGRAGLRRACRAPAWASCGTTGRATHSLRKLSSRGRRPGPRTRRAAGAGQGELPVHRATGQLPGLHRGQGVRRGRDGTGEYRFLGLYTHAAHTATDRPHPRAPAQAGPACWPRPG